MYSVPPNKTVKMAKMGISLEVQWLGVRVSNAGSAGSIPGQRPRSHMLCGTVKKEKKKFFLKAKLFRIARGKEFWKLLHDHVDVFNTTELCVSSEK